MWLRVVVTGFCACGVTGLLTSTWHCVFTRRTLDTSWPYHRRRRRFFSRLLAESNGADESRRDDSPEVYDDEDDDDVDSLLATLASGAPELQTEYEETPVTADGGETEDLISEIQASSESDLVEAGVVSDDRLGVVSSHLLVRSLPLQ